MQAEATIAASQADFLVVAAHYPVWSVCEHGPTSEFVSRLKYVHRKDTPVVALITCVCPYLCMPALAL